MKRLAQSLGLVAFGAVLAFGIEAAKVGATSSETGVVPSFFKDGNKVTLNNGGQTEVFIIRATGPAGWINVVGDQAGWIYVPAQVGTWNVLVKN